MDGPKLYKYMISDPALLTLDLDLTTQGSFHYAIVFYIYF